MLITRILAALLFPVYLSSDSANLTMMHNHLPIVGVVQRDQYPKGYFMFPIMPNQQSSLSGGFGDLRTNHFHAGLDIRTGGTTGYNVYAAADGYISRIGVLKGSYGNVIYITHPNGFTTLYGHLEKFMPKIAQYVKQKQYEQKNWGIELYPAPNEIKVRKGEVIALSGNTGASGGPHLHFEIRDKTENAINPMLFSFPEVVDSQPPGFEKLVIRTLTTDSRVEGEFGRFSYNPISQGYGSYGLSKPIRVKGTLGLELLAFDRSETSPFRMGISILEVKLDGKTTYKIDLEKMPFDISKDINVHIDYAAAETNGVKIQKCYISDGNRLSVYETDKNRGKLHITDDQSHQVTITAKDAYDNTSTLNFDIIGEQNPPNLNLEIPKTRGVATVSTSIIENMLIIRARNVKGENPVAVLQNKGIPTQVPLAYVEDGEAFFLHDLRQGLVDFVQVGDASDYLDIKKVIYPQGTQLYNEPNLSVDFTDALYDTLYLSTHQNAGKLSINTEKIPIKDFIEIVWNPANVSHSEKSSVYYVDDGRKFLGGNWTDKGISFKTKELGNFQVLTDNEAPYIRPIEVNENELVFAISDNLSGIRNFRCEVNGQWVLMDYEYKSARIWSDKLNDLEPFTGDLVLEVTDNVGNIATFTANIEELQERLAAAKVKHHKKHGKAQHGKVRKGKSSPKHSSKKSKRRHR